MPKETKKAVDWAMSKTYVNEHDGIVMPVQDKRGNINSFALIHFVNKYFAENQIKYGTYSFHVLKPYLP